MKKGLGDPCRRIVIVCEAVTPGVGVVGEEQNVDRIRLNAIASEAFVATFNYQDAGVQNDVHDGVERNIITRNAIVEAEDRQLIQRESFGDKRKRRRRESPKQKRRETLDDSMVRI